MEAGELILLPGPIGELAPASGKMALPLTTGMGELAPTWHQHRKAGSTPRLRGQSQWLGPTSYHPDPNSEPWVGLP